MGYLLWHAQLESDIAREEPNSDSKHALLTTVLTLWIIWEGRNMAWMEEKSWIWEKLKEKKDKVTNLIYSSQKIKTRTTIRWHNPATRLRNWQVWPYKLVRLWSTGTLICWDGSVNWYILGNRQWPVKWPVEIGTLHSEHVQNLHSNSTPRYRLREICVIRIFFYIFVYNSKKL